MKELTPPELVSFQDIEPLKQAEKVLAFGMEFARKHNLTPIATTSGGKYSATLMNLLGEFNYQIPVIFVDMGPACYTEATIEMITGFQNAGRDIRKRFSTIASATRPPSGEELDFIYGPNWRDPKTPQYDLVMNELKVAPCQEALVEEIENKNSSGVLLIRGVREDKNISERVNIPWFAPHELGVTLYPIAKWTEEDVTTYLNGRGLPVNLQHFDPSRARTDEQGEMKVLYPDGTFFEAVHTVCSLDRAIKQK